MRLLCQIEVESGVSTDCVQNFSSRQEIDFYVFILVSALTATRAFWMCRNRPADDSSSALAVTSGICVPPFVVPTGMYCFFLF